MVSWLFICAAIVKYAEKNSGNILMRDEPITLNEVLNIYKELNPKNKDAEFLSDYLNAYVEDRKQYFTKLIERGDYRGEIETRDDKDFVFIHENKTLI
jgi:hypothetical protein